MTAQAPTYTSMEIHEAVHRIASSLINTEKLSEDTQLMDQGLDSLGAPGLANGLAKEFGIKLLPSLVFNHPSINDIIRYIEGILEISDTNVLSDTTIVRTTSSSSGDMGIEEEGENENAIKEILSVRCTEACVIRIPITLSHFLGLDFTLVGSRENSKYRESIEKVNGEKMYRILLSPPHSHTDETVDYYFDYFDFHFRPDFSFFYPDSH